MEKKYYKIIFSPNCPPSIGTIINTDYTVDNYRIKRFSELNPLCELIYNCSEKFNLQLQYIIDFLNSNWYEQKKMKVEEKELNKALYWIKKEAVKSHFKLLHEFRYFPDFILDKVKNENLQNSDLPNRFKVNYFFESIDDCKKYIQSLNNNYYYTKIVEVEFIDIISLDKFDNFYTSNFEQCTTARSFYLQALLYLLKNESNTPIWEVLFRGTYRVSNHLTI